MISPVVYNEYRTPSLPNIQGIDLYHVYKEYRKTHLKYIICSEFIQYDYKEYMKNNLTHRIGSD